MQGITLTQKFKMQKKSCPAAYSYCLYLFNRETVLHEIELNILSSYRPEDVNFVFLLGG